MLTQNPKTPILRFYTQLCSVLNYEKILTRCWNARTTCGGSFKVPQKEASIAQIEAEMALSSFWENKEVARLKSAQLSQLKREHGQITDFKRQVEDFAVLWELANDEASLDSATLLEVEKTLKTLLQRLASLEVLAFLSGPQDSHNAILSIHAGAGGTESCDWAQMLLRMYTRWAEREGYTVEVQDLQAGEEAGIQTACLRIIGPHAYGHAKAERGVHRLVRISPFDSNSRRHTSFCAVDVIAEVEDDAPIEILDKDLRIDTYRAGGAGGQHVNKTDSAVRITHLPTNIVVACQNERSQHKNKAAAMKVLKSKLYEKVMDEKRSQMEQFYSEKGEIGWGYQIRSYVFQPYQMVKDLRTGTESSNLQTIMDGDINPFIHSWLRNGCPRKRLES